VLLDIGLPLMDGYETACRIRAEPWGKDLILIALTGWGQVEARRRSQEAGFDAHLVKPVDPGILIEEIGQCRVRRAAAARQDLRAPA
jgi:CheY-like chemotaxis protein